MSQVLIYSRLRQTRWTKKLTNFIYLTSSLKTLYETQTLSFKTFQVYDLVEGPKDYQNRLKTAADMRKDIETTFQSLSGANDILAKLLTDDKKAELAEEVKRCIAEIHSQLCTIRCDKKTRP